eukprot:232597_1
MSESSLAFILYIAFTCIFPVRTAQTNITFKSSPILLDVGLFGHLITIYDDSMLNIFGGNTDGNGASSALPSQNVYTLQLTLPDTVDHHEISTLPDWTYVVDAPRFLLGDPEAIFMNPT